MKKHLPQKRADVYSVSLFLFFSFVVTFSPQHESEEMLINTVHEAGPYHQSPSKANSISLQGFGFRVQGLGGFSFRVQGLGAFLGTPMIEIWT